MSRKKLRPVRSKVSVMAGDRTESKVTYAEWLSIANYHPDQDTAWRDHEYWARKNRADDDLFIEIGVIELGGEA